MSIIYFTLLGPNGAGKTASAPPSISHRTPLTNLIIIAVYFTLMLAIGTRLFISRERNRCNLIQPSWLS